MRLLILLLFPTLLFAQPDLQGDWWRIRNADTTAFATTTPDVEMPKCLVSGAISQCRLVFSKPIYDRSPFTGGNTATRAWKLAFELVVEPFNSKYESGDVIVEIGNIINLDVLFMDTGGPIVALCNTSFSRQTNSNTYTLVAFVPCGDDIMVPVPPTVESAPTPFSPLVNNAVTDDPV